MDPKPGPDTRHGLPSAVLLACALAAALWAGRGEFARHQAYWFGGAGARISLPYAELSPAMDEAGLRQQLAAAVLRCTDAADARICEADLTEANGVAAGQLRATWRQGRLQQTEVFVPWWAQHQAARALAAQLGGPSGFDPAPTAPGVPRQMRWTLRQGTVQTARDPGWNPWRWGVVRWTAPDRSSTRSQNP